MDLSDVPPEILREIMANRFQYDGKGSAIDKVVRYLAKKHADDTILSYPDEEGNYDINLTGSGLERTSAYAATKYAETIKQLGHGGGLSGDVGYAGIETQIVAMISLSTISSYVTFTALHRLGYSPMIISPRLAESGYAHLLKVTGCHTVVAAGSSLEMIKRLKANGYDGVLDIIPMLDDAEAVRGLEEPPIDLPEVTVNPGYIIHTGGTTGLPQPVGFDAASFPPNYPLAPDGFPPPRMVCTVPFFHAYGINLFITCLQGPGHLFLLNAHRPVTASNIWKTLDNTRAMMMLTVPYVLKFFTEIEGGIERLAKVYSVRSAGAAMPESLAELLIENGVKLDNMYGQTEAGPLMTQAGYGSDEWKWLTPQPHSQDFMEFEKVGDDMYHLVLKPGLKSLKASDRPDGSYGTKDLFKPHPDNQPGSDTRAGKAKWKFLARQGDIIVLINGENADPTPIEQAVMLNPYVQMAVAFGAGHERMGLLVIPSEKATDMSKEDIIAAIKPAIEKGNQQASDYAKISPDDIIVKPVGTEYPQTAKMTLQRPVLNRLFASDIEAHYDAMEKTNDAPVESLTEEDVHNVVRKVVEKELWSAAADSGGQGQEMSNEDDFFSMGMDSLQSSIVRKRLLREIPLPKDATIPINAVFENPSVNLLTGYLNNLRLGKSNDRDTEALSKAMLEKYTALVTGSTSQAASNGTTNGNGSAAPEGHVILLTGATGYIGAQLLNKLLSRSDVSRVYALVRTRPEGDHDAATLRIRGTLDKSQLTADLEASKGLSKLTCLSANLAKEDLGLSAEEYGNLKSSVTDIIHNAWSVNFNMSLHSFEPNVASVANLLSLTRTHGHKPKTFVFISSIAAAGAGRAGAGEKILEQVYNWDEATPFNGYGQSKWVAEQLCSAAAKSAAGQAHVGPIRVIRLGQIAGDSKNGVWNPTEANPVMVQSALTIGVLPRMEQSWHNNLRWIPSDDAAAAIGELTLAEAGPSDESKLAVFHVSSPHLTKWNDDVLPALEKAGLSFKAVPQVEWVKILSESDTDVRKNPPFKLLEHFKLLYGNDMKVDGDEDMELSIMDLTQSLKVSKALQNSSKVDSDMVAKYAKFWMGLWAKSGLKGANGKA